jgi:hypothetical protein
VPVAHLRDQREGTLAVRQRLLVPAEQRGDPAQRVERAGQVAALAARIANGRNGVRLDGGATQVGGTGANAGNLISGNTAAGVEVHSNNNLIGGTAAGSVNVLSGNTNDGLDIDVPAAGNTIQGNLIGTAPGRSGWATAGSVSR